MTHFHCLNRMIFTIPSIQFRFSGFSVSALNQLVPAAANRYIRKTTSQGNYPTSNSQHFSCIMCASKDPANAPQQHLIFLIADG